MIKKIVKLLLRYFGYEIHAIESKAQNREQTPVSKPLPIEPVTKPPLLDPVWPLPRQSGGLSDEEIRKAFEQYSQWHYAYKFEGDLFFPAHRNYPDPLIDDPERPLQRFRHFMPYLVEAQNGSLQGKRILDIACNSGFWSIQCALLGAEVIGFDARVDLIDQANLIKSIVGINNVDFRVLDFLDMSPQLLGGKFDIVLNLGILYHLPKPLEVLELTKLMAREYILLDTIIHPSDESVLRLYWEEPADIQLAMSSGIITHPSRYAIDLMLKHIRAAEWFEIPLRTTGMPRDYLDHRRASWLIKV